MDLKESGISPAYSVALPLCETAVTIPPSRPTFVDLHVSQFGWSAVSPSRPAISQSVGRSGGQGKRRAWRARRALDLDGPLRPAQRLIRLGASELPLPLPTIPTARREAEAGSPSKSVTTTPSIAVILLTLARTRLRRPYLEHFALNAQLIPGPRGPGPAELIEAGADDTARGLELAFDQPPHRERRRVPPARGQSLEDRVECSLLVEMEGLRVELSGKSLDPGVVQNL